MGLHPHLMSGQVTPKPAQTSQRAQNKQKSNCFFLVIRSLGFTLGSFWENLALFGSTFGSPWLRQARMIQWNFQRRTDTLLLFCLVTYLWRGEGFNRMPILIPIPTNTKTDTNTDTDADTGWIQNYWAVSVLYQHRNLWVSSNNTYFNNLKGTWISTQLMVIILDLKWTAWHCLLYLRQ